MKLYNNINSYIKTLFSYITLISWTFALFILCESYIYHNLPIFLHYILKSFMYNCLIVHTIISYITNIKIKKFIYAVLFIFSLLLNTYGTIISVQELYTKNIVINKNIICAFASHYIIAMYEIVPFGHYMNCMYYITNYSLIFILILISLLFHPVMYLYLCAYSNMITIQMFTIDSTYDVISNCAILNMIISIVHSSHMLYLYTSFAQPILFVNIIVFLHNMLIMRYANNIIP